MSSDWIYLFAPTASFPSSLWLSLWNGNKHWLRDLVHGHRFQLFSVSEHFTEGALGTAVLRSAEWKLETSSGLVTGKQKGQEGLRRVFA